MSDPLAEIPTSAADFRSRLKSAYRNGGTEYPRKIEFLGVFSDGTRYMVENGVRAISFYLVTDLTAPERRVGQTSVTIALGANLGFVNQNLSPALVDAIANYRLFGTTDFAQAGIMISLVLTSQTNLTIRAFRIQSLATSSTTNVTVAGNDLTDAVGMTVSGTPTTVTDPHGSDISFFPHGHTTTGHPVTDPGHFHNLGSTGVAAITFNVDWLIWHV